MSAAMDGHRPLRFDGRVAVVTGGGRGLGLAHAQLLAARGAQVVVNDVGAEQDGSGGSSGPARDAVDAIRSNGGQAVADLSDISTAEGARQLIATAIEHFGRIDVVVNNAGIWSWEAFVDLDWEYVRRVLDVHVGGSFQVTQAAWPHFVQQGYGRVVMTTSGAGLFGATHSSHYAAAKMALVGLTRALAIEGAAAGITVNAVSPGAATRGVDALTTGPLQRWMKECLPVELVSPVFAYLAHESCTLSGEVLKTYGGVVSRVVIGATRGFGDPGLSLEDVADHLGDIMSMTDLDVFTGTSDELVGMVNRVGNLRGGDGGGVGAEVIEQLFGSSR